MSVYLALLIPIVVTFIFYYFKKHMFTWWEFFVPIFSVLIAVVISKAIINYNAVNFTEYWGSTITAVFEEEPYNYWQHQTCSYTTTDSKGNSTTHYYDCSHQEDVGPSWWAVTNINEEFSITEKQHDELVAQFKTKKNIIESRRNHSARSKCIGSSGTKFEGKRVGETSLVYQTYWNGSDDTRKAYVSRHKYVNKVKASDLTIFNISLVNDKQADSLGLFKYPEYRGGGLFSNTQGLDYPTILGGNIDKETHEKFKRLNGKFGVSNESRLWILVFENKPLSIAQNQENYWVKGNKNELVICIGKNGNEILWSYAFSWAHSEVLTIEIKNKVLELYTYKDSIIKKSPQVILVPKQVNNKILGDKEKKLPEVLPIPNQSTGDSIIKIKSPYPMLTEKTWNDLYFYLNENLHRFERRSFDEFDYLTVEPSTGAIIFVYIFALFITIGTNLWVTNNDIYDESNHKNENKRKNSWVGNRKY
jgi:hypothetical protein